MILNDEDRKKALRLINGKKGDVRTGGWDDISSSTLPLKDSEDTPISCGVDMATGLLNCYFAAWWNGQKNASPVAFFMANLAVFWDANRYSNVSALVFSDFISMDSKGFNSMADHAPSWAAKGKTSEFLKFVKEQELGKVVATPTFKNRNSGNPIKVWTWILPTPAELKKLLQAEGLVTKSGELAKVAK